MIIIKYTTFILYTYITLTMTTFDLQHKNKYFNQTFYFNAIKVFKILENLSKYLI